MKKQVKLAFVSFIFSLFLFSMYITVVKAETTYDYYGEVYDTSTEDWLQGVTVYCDVNKDSSGWVTKDTDTTDSVGYYHVSWTTWGVGLYLVRIHFVKSGYMDRWIYYPSDGQQADIYMRPYEK